MKVTVVGMGYVGAVAAAELAQVGHFVTGVDIDTSKVERFLRGDVPFHEPGLSVLMHNAQLAGNLRFSHVDDLAADDLGNVVLICTGTPPTVSGSADLRQVRTAIKWLRERRFCGILVMKSTVPPGTGCRLLSSDLSGMGVLYVSNPEFLREGQAVQDWEKPDRLVFGVDRVVVLDTVRELYAGISCPHVVTDITSAEMIKYAANGFLATKVSFVNEIAAICDKVHANIDDVVAGISLDPRIGAKHLSPGVGYGGSCFPKDVRALDFLALRNGHNFELLRSVMTVNNRQRLIPLTVLHDVFARLVGVEVGVLGLSFKPNTDDIRESPAVSLIGLLVEEGVLVRAFDPIAGESARASLPASVQIVDSPEECAAGAHAAILMTEWPQIVAADWKRIVCSMKGPRLVFDGRNALDPQLILGYGGTYRGVGRGTVSRLQVQSRAASALWGSES